MPDPSLVSGVRANGPSAGAIVRSIPMAGLLIALVLMVILAPLLEEIRGGDTAEGALLTAIFLLALPAMGARRNSRVYIVAVALLAPALIAKWLNHLAPQTVHPAVFLVPAILFLLLCVLCLLRFILSAPRVDANVLYASAAGYLLLALLWSLAYTLTARINPDAFVFTVGPAQGHTIKGSTAMYYSIITLTTVGYGDIVPVVGISRTLAAIEAMCGTFYMAVLVARLVGIHASARPATTAATDATPERTHPPSPPAQTPGI